jgi:hypothetical protein
VSAPRPPDPRPPAPPYAGEGGFALWHLSEDPDLARLVPRHAPADPDAGEVVWAVDTRHAPLYWFPRDCPRGCVWRSPTTTDEDVERFFGQSAATRLHVIESSWLDRVRECRLYAYELPAEHFEPHGVGGYWVSTHAVEASGRHDVGDLIGRHVSAGFELRVTPSIWPFWRRVAASSLEFSGCRLGNAAPEPGEPSSRES